jgi:hypothetical protein
VTRVLLELQVCHIETDTLLLAAARSERKLHQGLNVREPKMDDFAEQE